MLHADLSEEPRYLFEEGAYASRRQNKLMVHQLEEHLPPEMVRMLRELGETAEAMGMNAHIVGGFVRDIFLRRDNLDVDLVIEGDGIAFAQKVAAQHKVKVKVHRTFGTAVLSLPRRLQGGRGQRAARVLRATGGPPPGGDELHQA